MSDEADSKRDGPLVNIVLGNDVAGLGRAGEALIRGIQSGVGAALEPRRRRQLAAADQDAARGWAKLVAENKLELRGFEVTTREGRADLRISADTDRHQANREAVAIGALDEAQLLQSEKTVSEGGGVLEAEWLNRFWRLAQEIEREDLQSLWGRVLARQATGAGAIGARTLEALSMLDGSEITELTRLALLVCGIRRGRELIHEGFIANVYGAGPSEELNEACRILRDAIGAKTIEHFAAIGFIGHGIAYEPAPGDTVTVGARTLGFGDHVSKGAQLNLSGTAISKVASEIFKLVRLQPYEADERVVAALVKGVAHTMPLGVVDPSGATQ